MAENRTYFRKQASCNISLDIQFRPDDIPSPTTVQTGTTVVVVSIQKGNINTTYRVISATPTIDVTSLTYPLNVKVEPGTVNEIEVSYVDRILEESET